MRRFRAAALALAMVLACSLPPESTVPARVLVSEPAAWSDCGAGFRCTRVTVPVDHRDPAGPTLELGVTVLPAGKPEERLGLLFVNPGGPGISAIGYLRSSWSRLGFALHDRFDLAAFDTRGTGSSAPLDCHSGFTRLMDQSPSPASEAEWQGAVDASRAFAEECAAKHPDLLPFMSSLDNADDLDAIREALGEKQVSVLGYSYGTVLAAAYASRHPDRLRAAVLDGAVQPELELLPFVQEQSLGVEGALLAYDAVAAEKGWDGIAVIDRLHPHAPRKSTFLYALAEGVTRPGDGWHRLSRALAQARAGDWTGLQPLYDDYFRKLSVEAELGNLCADLNRLPSPEAYRAALPDVAREAPHFGSGNLLSHLPCAFWVAPAHGPVEKLGSGKPLPLLVIANRDDPLTPPAWGERMAARFASAVLLRVDSREHTAFGGGDRCVDPLVEAFFVTPGQPARDACP
jgi:pimeloyl-ACP methyl ester carboxylesterase